MPEAEQVVTSPAVPAVPGITEQRLAEAQEIEDRWRAAALDLEAIDGHAVSYDIGDLWCELLAEVRRLQAAYDAACQQLVLRDQTIARLS